MKLKRKEFLQAIKFLLPAIGEIESRRNLMNLHVQLVKGKVIFTGADAYKIKRAIIGPETLILKHNFDPFLIPRNLLVFYRQMLIQSKDDFCEINANELLINGHGIKYNQPEIEYPNLENLISGPFATTPEKDSVISLNTEMVMDSMREFPGKPYAIVKVTFGKGKEPILKFDTMGGAYTVILMPVRVKW